MHRRCRDCMRCQGIFGGGGDLDPVLVLCTCGLWILWVRARPHCPRCAHLRRAHTRSNQRWHRQEYWRSVAHRQPARQPSRR